jgi:WD40 repeat protein
MRRALSLLFIMAVLLTACGAPAAAPVTTSPAVPSQPVLVAPGATSTEVASSILASPTVPAASATPAATLTPTAPPAPAVIGLDNFSQLVQLHDYSADVRAVVKKLKGPESAQPQSNLVFSPDGKRLAFCIDVSWDSQWPKGTIVIMDTLTGDLVSASPLTERNLVFSLTFTPDGKKLVYFTYPDNRLVFWDIAAKKEDEVRYKKDNHASVGLALSPDGTQIMSIDGVASENGAGASLTVWDARTSKIVRQMTADYQYSYILRLSTDGRRLVVSTARGASELTVYDTSTWKKISTIRPPGSGAKLAAISPDGADVLTGNFDNGDLLIWDAGTGKQVQLLKTPFVSIADFKFSPDGSLLIVTGNPPSSKTIDDSLYTNAAVFDPSTWKQAGILHWDAVSWIGFAPDGKSLLALQSSGPALIGLPDEKIVAARQVAADFIGALSQGDYVAAAPLFNLYAEEIKALQSKGMTTDPAALLQAVCTQGAFPCLPAKVIYTASQASDVDKRQSPPMYFFLAQFTQADGSLYRDADGLSMLSFYVVQDTDGKYKVDLGMDLSYILKK